MEGHGLATLFLAGSRIAERDEARQKKLTAALARAVKFLVKSQSSQGGWHHTSRLEGHDFDEFLPTVIQHQALVAAGNAGIVISHDTLLDTEFYLQSALAKHELKHDEKGGKRGDVKASDRPFHTAAALACLIDHGNTYPGDPSEKHRVYCRSNIPVGNGIQFGRDELIHHYYAQALVDSKVWDEYRSAMFDHLQKTQDADGSWPAAEGLGIGRVYATALWCTVLQSDHKSHPSRRPRLLEVK